MKTLMTLVVCPIIAVAAINEAHISAYVIDVTDKTPLRGVEMVASFEDDIGWRAWTDSPKPDIVRAISDSNGICRFRGRTNCGRSSCWIEKLPDGYYKPPLGSGIIKYDKRSMFGVWQPENIVVTIALQRVECPIPLYVRHVQAPRNNNNVVTWDGTNSILKYDFIIGDWLPPAGSGKCADMVIATHLQVGDALQIWRHVEKITFYDFISSIEFPGEGNGLCEKIFDNAHSGIKIRNAPDAGYNHTKIIRVGRTKRKEGPNIFPKDYDEYDKSRCYCFRIRSKFDNKGNLVEAYYGKVYDDFKIGAHIDTGLNVIRFLYYLNLKSLDRNLEWDMKNNLCPNPGRIDPLQP